ncbi:hypothetical protein CCU68_33670 [Pseudomonas gingeri NCPPB 3146 = LMG 5327]|uniref:Uncharacterized protein n=2 Tax=Pseudomonas gingeri TaxID=117681 RepID=A0A7Y8CG44_9PSED|nr:MULTISPECIES: hypothetical protein [Pseudomonas]NVZ27768.1 hypothetical protein [Pseudomonas gingeri]NWA02552.1 hypothetical protein [Pseudomonas gingeri]NWA12275.1 hypothetical protein [Pseudomonas gingeri]NWA57319.1 hypothetical protein [Pseudomonas gingeri]NWA93662.1 hypothetical protein [Pseudomonas gingeri]
MNFSAVVQEFRNALPGTDSFKRVRVQCEQIIRTLPEQAAICFVIGEFCRAYVLFYEDQEVRPEFAQQIQAQLLGYMDSLDEALRTADSGLIAAALNEVVVAYAGSRGLV